MRITDYTIENITLFSIMFLRKLYGKTILYILNYLL
jgi:hypothetical protein